MTRSTTATLECAAQVSAAASEHGDAPARSRPRRAAAAGWARPRTASPAARSWCSAISIRPSPIATRPRSRGPRLRAAAEHQDAEQDQRRRDRGHVEGQHLDDQRGADIGAEHGGQRRHQVDQPAGGKAGDHQAGRRAALQHRGHAQPGEERLDPVAAAPGPAAAAARRRRRAARRSAPCAAPHSRSAMAPARSTRVSVTAGCAPDAGGAGP